MRGAGEGSRLDLLRRPRRLRAGPGTRGLVAETTLEPSHLVQPLFLADGGNAREPIESLPGLHRLGGDALLEEVRALAALGVPAVALFPRIDPAIKTPDGRRAALDPDGLVPRAVAAIKEHFPAMLVVADVALDPYTDHGHDGVVDPASGTILNDETVAILCEQATVLAAAGADWVAPSDMMDGRVGAIRRALDQAGHTETVILAYAAKFASAYYGPFRDAVGSRPAGGAYLDKAGYQLPPGNRREALMEAEMDLEEGADILMIKPAGPYLDIIREVRDRVRIPVAAYQVSGEYAQILAASANGWLDRAAVRDESLLSIRRAGADLILTYFAREFAESVAKG